MMRIPAVILVVAGCAVGAPAAAQQTQRIAAIVNDDIVSAYDLTARLKMVTISSGLKITAQVRERLAPQVLRGLIDERIRAQEAKRRNISVTKSNMRRALAVIAKRNNVAPGKLKEYLADSGISVDTVMSQIRSQIAWSKLVNRRLRPRITISEEEIEEVLGRIKARRGQTEYRIAEILLIAQSPEQVADTRGNAQRLAAQLRAGARFAVVARQFSESSSARNGGDLGWFHQADLDSELKAVIARMTPGQVSDPVFSLAGFRIVKLIDTRRVAAASRGEVMLTLRQIVLPLARNAGREAVASQMGLARTLVRNVSGCADMVRAAKEVGSPSSVELGTIKAADLSPAIRTAVGGLAIGKVSAPLRTRSGILVLMVCGRDEPKSRLPSRREIEIRLTTQRLSLLERRYMRDLRTAAVVDMRL
jgi:peptidyl-prolyl cis-trans isomerase SurA